MIRELLSYRLHEVANLLSRGAELRYRREFGAHAFEQFVEREVDGLGDDRPGVEPRYLEQSLE